MRHGIWMVLMLVNTSIWTYSQPWTADSFAAKVIGIKDGDTYVVLYRNEEIVIRLEHIDCPESGQAYGKNAKQYASKLCFGKTIEVLHHNKIDRYGRLIATLYDGDININLEMVRVGYAWHFKKYSQDKEYDQMEKDARSAKRGLWADDNAISPSEWRALKRNKSATQH